MESQIIEIATSRPTDLGLGFTTWYQAELEEFVRSQPEWVTLGRETIRRILHRHSLRFLTGQTWCRSTDPDFEVKNPIILLYTDSPDAGPVGCFAELGPRQTIPRGGKSWSRLATRRSSRYSRKNGMLQFFAVFCPHTGVAPGRGTARKTSEDSRDFLQNVVIS